MARKRYRSFHEPWLAIKDRSWQEAYKFGPPKYGETPEDVSQNVADWEARKATAEERADWLVFGSKITEPQTVKSFGAEPRLTDGSEILLVVRRLLYLPDGAPDQEHICKRIVECVNAMAGVGDPAAFIADVRSLLDDYARGGCLEDPRTDTRIISLLSRCIPPDQQEKHRAEED